ncbi:MAG: hypothetical protein H6719_16125 [Sandaracinaceae bacterium]|nr:hypothetical protein [Sandaracinaceae bacterium]
MSTVGWMGLSLVIALAAFVILGMRVGFPHHRKVAGVVWGLGWIPLAISVVHHRAEIETQRAVLASVMQGHEMHLALAAVLLVVGYLVRVLFPSSPGAAPELDEATLTARVDEDLAHLGYLFDRVEEATTALLESGIHAERGQSLSAADEERARAMWARFVEATFELDLLKSEYRSFYTVSAVSRPRIHARCFLVAYASYVAAYRAAVLVTRWVGEDETLRTVLDEANPAHDLPADSYQALLRRTVHPESAVRLNAGRAYLKLHEDRVREERVFPRTKGYLGDIEDVIAETPHVFADNPLDYLERAAFDLWFPIQKTVTKGLSAVHVPSRDHYVSVEDLRGIASRLEPGDILLTRREWHLTNLGIPGFWTHASLYTGTLAEMDAYFGELEGPRPSEQLRERLPEVHAALGALDEGGNVMCVVEAVTKGVKVSALETAGSADSLAVLRPRVSKADKLTAVLIGLGHVGKPYDYNFDLATDGAIFCSELVHEAYHPVEGVHFEPEIVSGRLMLSPNAICEKLERDDQLEHVLFLDGVDQGRVESRDADALRQSCHRPKWHILLAD